MGKRVGIVRFLGTNCDRDVWQALEWVGLEPEWLWYQDQFVVGKYAAIILPGGFSYGDYLRCGALAARTPVMKSVREAFVKGLPILGICNGFQILCEAEILQGALLGNKSGKFIDKWVHLNIEHPCSFAPNLSTAKLPVAHGWGRYFASADQLNEIEGEGRVWCRYSENPNGSVNNIAGVLSLTGRAAGLMPHPERAMRDWMGGGDGWSFFSDLPIPIGS